MPVQPKAKWAFQHAIGKKMTGFIFDMFGFDRLPKWPEFHAQEYACTHGKTCRRL